MASLCRHGDSVPRSAPDEQSRKGRAGQAVTRSRASRTIADRPDIATARGTPSRFDLGGGKEGFIHGSQLRTSRLSRPLTEKENPSNFFSSSETGIEQVLISVNPYSLDRLTRTRKFTHT